MCIRCRALSNIGAVAAHPLPKQILPEVTRCCAWVPRLQTCPGPCWLTDPGMDDVMRCHDKLLGLCRSTFSV